jgi:hypothetical protein
VGLMSFALVAGCLGGKDGKDGQERRGSLKGMALFSGAVSDGATRRCRAGSIFCCAPSVLPLTPAAGTVRPRGAR